MNGMTLIVKQVTKLVIGFILVYSCAVVLYGHLSPGGGFVGGVMLACGFILLVLLLFFPSGQTGLVFVSGQVILPIPVRGVPVLLFQPLDIIFIRGNWPRSQFQGFRVFLL